ncbi:hypothetical protein G7Y79_00053g088280 [Physcia stellaris]|nr:hypothetical protein G7Y79_00053g088280 [Physcia stellaris]
MTIDAHVNNTADVIPGGSPFFYLEDPKNNGFQIQSISVTPTPCQIGLPCTIEAKGEFQSDLSKIELNFEVEARFKGGHSGKVLTRKDDLCDWATVRQAGRSQCPPNKGSATITTELLLASFVVPEATYDIDLNLTSGNTLLTHVGARVKLEDADKLVADTNPAETP